MGRESAPLGLGSNYDSSQPEEKADGLNNKLKKVANATMLAGALSGAISTSLEAREIQQDLATRTTIENVVEEEQSIKDKMEEVNGFMLGEWKNDFSGLANMQEGQDRSNKAVDLLGFMSKMLNEFAVDNQDYHNNHPEFKFGNKSELPDQYHKKFLNILNDMRSMYKDIVEKYGVDESKEPHIVLKLGDFDRAISTLEQVVDQDSR
jgi:hypothetical protein